MQRTCLLIITSNACSLHSTPPVCGCVVVAIFYLVYFSIDVDDLLHFLLKFSALEGTIVNTCK